MEPTAQSVQVVDSSTVSTERFRISEELSSESILAIDCEGVDLSRHGTLCIVQIASRSTCYLFDILDDKAADVEPSLISIIKILFENKELEKVIHDCRMDSDTLYHQYGICLNNVHDTQAWDKIIRRLGGENLNNTLRAYDCEANMSRNRLIYALNPAFWSIRPLTPEMITMASGDVQVLFSLREAQIERACGNNLNQRCHEASQQNAIIFQNLLSEVIAISKKHVGRFIGPKGKNVKELSRRFSCEFYSWGPRDSAKYLVYAPSQSVLEEILVTLRERSLLA